MRTKIITLLTLATMASFASAGTTTGSTKAIATMQSACTISASDVSFGELSITANYTNISKWGHIKSIANVIKVLCNNKLPYKLAGPALITKGSSVGRFMSGNTDASETLQYNVYLNTDLTNGWFADGSSYGSYGVAAPINSTGTGVEKNHTLHFAIYNPKAWPGYWPKPDTYSDTYTLTLTY